MKRKSIAQTLFASNLLISFSAVLGLFLVCVFVVLHEYRQDAAQVRQNYMELQKNSLYAEAAMVAEFVQLQQVRGEERTRQELKDWVDQAHDLLQASFEQKASRPTAMRTLRSLRLPPGVSRFLTYESSHGLDDTLLDGLGPREALSPPQSARIAEVEEGLKELFSLRDQGYYSFRWWKQGEPGDDHLVSTYFRYLAPYRFYIGALAYQSEEDSLVKAQALQNITRFRFGSHGGLFVTDSRGQALQPHPLLEDQGIARRCASAVQSGGGFLEHDGHLVYVQSLGAWGWHLGIGVRLDELEAIASQQRDSLHARLRQFALFATLLLLAFLGLAFALSWLHTRSLAQSLRSILGSFHSAENSLTHIATSTIELDEFLQIAHSANQLLEARSHVEAERERLLNQIEEKSREFEHILYIASHDLRAPLVNLKGFASEMEADLAPLDAAFRQPLPPDAAQWLLLRGEYASALESRGYIHKSIERLDRVLRGLLSYSRMGRLEPQLQTVDSNRLLRELTDSMQFRLRESRCELVIQALPPCIADPLLLQQVFQNILDNAIKYAKPGEAPHITITGTQQNDRVSFAVSDQGIGIAPAHLPKVFDLFYRSGEDGSVNGEGLGLALVQRMVRRMEGHIEVRSETGVGTTFELTLPSPEKQP